MDHRVLVADASNVIVETISKALTQESHVVVRTVSNGREFLEELVTFKPHLVIIDLTLPVVHGVELLKRLKSDPLTCNIGVIISTWRALSQDYQAVMEHGADYYLIKPFSHATIVKLIRSFFAGTLKPAPFPLESMQTSFADSYLPILEERPYMRFWGTRGSIPVAGNDYLVFGGSTPCLELSDHENMVIIDAGTGIRPLGKELLKSRYKELHLIIGHTHWDHILGFPFFDPVYSSKYEIHIYAAKGFGKNVDELFRGMLDRDYFPVKLDEMQAKLTFHDLQDNEPIDIGKFKIHYTYASHPGATLCFKIETDKRKIGYATDNEVLVGYHGHPKTIDSGHPLLFPYRELISFFMGCDTLVHEAQYTPEEYLHKVGWGHSSISNACVLVKHCAVKNWIVTHHDPAASDAILRKRMQLYTTILQDCNYNCNVQMAYEGLLLPL